MFLLDNNQFIITKSFPLTVVKVELVKFHSFHKMSASLWFETCEGRITKATEMCNRNNHEKYFWCICIM